MEMLRPVTWLEAKRVAVGKRIRLGAGEISAGGWAYVLEIGPCPEIERGPGSVVTATYRHSSSETIDLRMSDGASIGVTTNHPIWSEDRHSFVPAGQLRRGEHVSTRKGIAEVVALAARSKSEPVLNIEVHGEHVYRVGDFGLLVHNNDDCPPDEFVDYDGEGTSRENTSHGKRSQYQDEQDGRTGSHKAHWDKVKKKKKKADYEREKRKREGRLTEDGEWELGAEE